MYLFCFAHFVGIALHLFCKNTPLPLPIAFVNCSLPGGLIRAVLNFSMVVLI